MRTMDKTISLDHFVSVETLDNQDVMTLIDLALEYKHHQREVDLSNKFAVNCFFEDSTRTHKSFEMAERKHGMQVIDFQPSTSSIKKGESLYDTILTLQAIGVNLAVIRHQKEAYYKELIESDTITCSIINGGDGAGQHPSQCLLDLVTIYEEFQRFEGLKIAIAGDLNHSRVARSNMQILHRLGAKLYFTGPNEWYAEEFNQYGEFKAIDELVTEVDVFMLLRVQHERHHSKNEKISTENYLTEFGLTIEREKQMKKDAIIMHPAPVNRGVEIASELVECPRSRIVRQMENGVYARMAIIEAVLNG